MLKKAVALLLIILAIYWSFSALIPHYVSNTDSAKTTFSVDRALQHLEEISAQPHYFGSPEHDRVKDYLIKQLENLGLEVQVQKGYSYDKKWKCLVKVENILAKIEGSDNTKALMLLSHYDSNPHSSLGASDDGSGIVTILEGLRAFLSNKKKPKNDIVILFSDAEELDLNGAHLFVTEHPWAKDIGLILNFEARGSGGPSYTLIETNGGNHNMIEGFKKSNPDYPVANSLMYSVYKMLPNDTDLTPMKEEGNIEGFNFAFIDDHFDYHTALDNYARLDRNTLEHQGSYLMPLLNYFSNADLKDMKSNFDDVYFNVPLLKLISYPFAWIIPMLVLTIILFLWLLIDGLRKKAIGGKDILKGFVPFLLVLIINGLIGYFGWNLLKSIYPQYGEILHGFPYNGHDYIWAFSFLSMGICFLVYHKFSRSENTGSLMIAPLFFWLVICSAVAFKLKGAAFFIIPLIFGLISLYFINKQKTPYLFLLVFLAGPALFILSPFVLMFPVGLGLKMLLASTIFITLIFGLLVSVFGYFDKRKQLSYILFLIALGFFISAHINSSFNEDRPKPNSLVYVFDADSKTAIWATYDHLLDEWTKSLITDHPEESPDGNDVAFRSKYNNQFSFTKTAAIKSLPSSKLNIIKDTLVGENRRIELMMVLQRPVNRVDIYSDTLAVFNSFKINDIDLVNEPVTNSEFNKRVTRSLLRLYITDEDSIKLDFSVPKNQKTEFEIFESSYDLLQNPIFNIPQRPKTMIPKPFVLNDAIIVKKTIAFE